MIPWIIGRCNFFEIVYGKNNFSYKGFTYRGDAVNYRQENGIIFDGNGFGDGFGFGEGGGAGSGVDNNWKSAYGDGFSMNDARGNGSGQGSGNGSESSGVNNNLSSYGFGKIFDWEI